MWADNRSRVVESLGSSKALRLTGLRVHVLQLKKNGSMQQPYCGTGYRYAGFTDITPSTCGSAETSYIMAVSGVLLEAPRSPLRPMVVM